MPYARLISGRFALTRLAIASTGGIVANIAVATCLCMVSDPTRGWDDRGYGIAHANTGFDDLRQAHVRLSVGCALAVVEYRILPVSEAVGKDEAFPDSTAVGMLSDLGLTDCPVEIRPEGPTAAAVAAFGVGWPYYSFRCMLQTTVTSDPNWVANLPVGWGYVPLRLPLNRLADPVVDWPNAHGIETTTQEDIYRPVAIGFLLNTLIFTSVFCIPLLIVPYVRRRLRSRSYACIACGYPLGRSSQCPECGSALGYASGPSN